MRPSRAHLYKRVWLLVRPSIGPYVRYASLKISFWLLSAAAMLHTKSNTLKIVNLSVRHLSVLPYIWHVYRQSQYTHLCPVGIVAILLLLKCMFGLSITVPALPHMTRVAGKIRENAFILKQARPGDDSSRLFLCVYWTCDMNGGTDGWTDRRYD